MDNDELVLIARFDTPFEAEEARIVLEEEEIECEIADETLGDIGLLGGASAGGVKLLVMASDAKRAVDALADTPARKDLVVEVTDEEDEPTAEEQEV